MICDFCFVLVKSEKVFSDKFICSEDDFDGSRIPLHLDMHTQMSHVHFPSAMFLSGCSQFGENPLGRPSGAGAIRGARRHEQRCHCGKIGRLTFAQ